MRSSIVLGLLGSVVVLVALFELLRRHRIREKYAVLWFVVALGVITLAVFPSLLTGVAELIGVEVPANLLFFAASLVLLLITLQHSYELGRLEEKTRVLAEEVALLRLEISSPAPQRGPDPADPGDGPERPGA
ncbi:DUF2304 domain-containing protein [Nocardioides pantholopis]|uniref:DUF2304 domain-containing protein n=1 Tax=Nocardioides pantholopis TaxID=2483798 RepID=UPI000F07D8F1|nr:DUF2304 domain-containing protein [Nocardioides pantholopis]